MHSLRLIIPEPHHLSYLCSRALRETGAVLPAGELFLHNKALSTERALQGKLFIVDVCRGKFIKVSSNPSPDHIPVPTLNPIPVLTSVALIRVYFKQNHHRYLLHHPSLYRARIRSREKSWEFHPFEALVRNLRFVAPQDTQKDMTGPCSSNRKGE